MLVDAGHLLAAAGRCTGLGAPRRQGRFSLPCLLGRIVALLPEAERPPDVLWFDGAAGERGTDLEELLERRSVDLEEVPVRGGRQRGLEALVLRAVLRPDLRGRRLYLVADPRRHATAVLEARRAGSRVTFIGVAYGEASPASDRVWLRRAEVEACVVDPTPSGTARRHGSGYRAPAVLRGTGEAVRSNF